MLVVQVDWLDLARLFQQLPTQCSLTVNCDLFLIGDFEETTTYVRVCVLNVQHIPHMSSLRVRAIFVMYYKKVNSEQLRLILTWYWMHRLGCTSNAIADKNCRIRRYQKRECRNKLACL